MGTALGTLQWYVLFFIAFSPIVVWSNLTKIAFICLTESLYTILTMVPIAPFVSPSATSIFVVIITCAPIFTQNILCKLPVSLGFPEREMLDNPVPVSFLESTAWFIYS